MVPLHLDFWSSQWRHPVRAFGLLHFNCICFIMVVFTLQHYIQFWTIGCMGILWPLFALARFKRWTLCSSISKAMMLPLSQLSLRKYNFIRLNLLRAKHTEINVVIAAFICVAKLLKFVCNFFRLWNHLNSVTFYDFEALSWIVLT